MWPDPQETENSLLAQWQFKVPNPISHVYPKTLEVLAKTNAYFREMDNWIIRIYFLSYLNSLSSVSVRMGEPAILLLQ